MSASGRAWECALVLAEHPEHLTLAQMLDVEIGIMAGPDEADLTLIALAVRMLGVRR